jgi:hypothetical protein
VGNGQYYDPATGRFLNRDTRSGQANPYVPWKADPAGAAIAPLALLALVYGNKKQRGKWDNLIILLVLCGVVGMSLSACGGGSATVTVGTTSVSGTWTPMPGTNNYHLTATATTATPVASSTKTFNATLTPTITPTLPPGCTSGVWYSGSEEDNGSLEVITKRIYFEGASSFTDKEVRKNVFMAQAWALRTLRAYLYGGSSYTWITQTAFSVSSQKDNAQLYDDNDYKEITRCILNSIPCAYGTNPWSSKAPGKAIQWISPQNLNRRNAAGEAVWIESDKVNGCNEGKGCQLPDMRSESWISNLPDLVGKVESFVDLGAIDTSGDSQSDFNECYWKGLYFFSDHNSFQTAVDGKYNPPPTPNEQESLKCPQGRSGERLDLPPMPPLYSPP